MSIGTFRGRRTRSGALGLALLAAFLGSSAAAGGKNKPLDAKLLDLDGDRVKLADLRGTPALLELWATWCLPCGEQSEVVEELAAEFEEREIAVYAVNVGEKQETVEYHLEREPSANPVLLDRLQTIPTRLGLVELPALVLLDADGVVAATAAGLTGREEVLTMLDEIASPPPSSAEETR